MLLPPPPPSSLYYNIYNILIYVLHVHPWPSLNCYRIIHMHKIILIFPVCLPIGTYNSILCNERLRVAQYILYCDFCDVSV